MIVAIAIAVLLAGVVVVLLVAAWRRAGAREAGTAATAHAPGALDPGASGVPAVVDDEAARARGADSRRHAESGVPVRAGGTGVVRYEPVDPEELGVTRRQFFNRGTLTLLSVAVGGFGATSIAFLWTSNAGGFGGKVDVGSIDDIEKSIADKQPFYNASAKVYIQPYPKADVAKAAKVYPTTIVAGMEQGYVALFQKCVHLGCRVPWCQTSQWFECPCHGSKYNRVGEKRGGPAPRGLDRFPLQISGGSMVVDTGTVVQGPPVGTDTTGQGQEGAPCV